MKPQPQVLAFIERVCGKEYEDAYMAAYKQGYKEAFRHGWAEGYKNPLINICSRLAQRKWGPLPEPLTARIEALGYTQLERLSEDLLDLGTLDDLTAWLDHTAR